MLRNHKLLSLSTLSSYDMVVSRQHRRTPSEATASNCSLAQALGAVLSRRIDAFPRGAKRQLGRALGSDASGDAATRRCTRILQGRNFPWQRWDAIAEFFDIPPETLLREIADEYVACRGAFRLGQKNPNS
jgi:hypothetical protein